MGEIKRSALLDTDFISKLYITKANDADRLIFRILSIPEFHFICHEQTKIELGRHNHWAAKWLNENDDVTIYTSAGSYAAEYAKCFEIKYYAI